MLVWAWRNLPRLRKTGRRRFVGFFGPRLEFHLRFERNAWAQEHFRGASEGALPIEVTAQQFTWNFRYAGADGKFGRTKPELVSASTGNPVGLDSTDPASKDDIVSPVIAMKELQNLRCRTEIADTN